MKHYKIVKDHGSHFEVGDSRDGKSFLVAKKGLSKKLMEQIQGMQRLADGGEVEPAPVSDMDFTNPDIFSQQAPVSSFDMTNSAVPGESLAPDAGPAAPAPTSAQTAQGDGGVTEVNTPEGVSYADPAQAPAPAPAAAAPQQAQAPQAPNQVQMPMMASTASALAFPAPPASVSDKPLVQAAQGEKAALAAQADAAARRGAEEAQLHDQELKLEEQRQRDEQSALQAEKARGDEFRKRYADGKVDPGRYFKNMSTEGKIMTFLSLAVGGYVNGKSGGRIPNYALQGVNDAVNADIEAQKMDLAKNKDLASMSDDERARLQNDFAKKKVDLLQLTKIRLEKLASGYSGAEAKAKADLLGAGIDSEIAKTQIGIAQHNAQQQYAYRVGKFQYEAASRAAVQQQGAQNVLQQMYSGREFQPGLQAMLPKEDRNRAVNMPNGNQRLAVSAEAATKYQEVQAAKDRIQTLAREAAQGSAENGRGFPRSNWSKRAAQIKAEMMTEWNKLAGLSRLSDAEIHQFGDIIPDASAWNQGGVQTMLGGIQGALDTATVSAQKEYLLGGMQGGGASSSGFSPKSASDYSK